MHTQIEVGVWSLVAEWFALWALNRKVGSSSPSVGMMFNHHFPSNNVMVFHLTSFSNLWANVVISFSEKVMLLLETSPWGPFFLGFLLCLLFLPFLLFLQSFLYFSHLGSFFLLMIFSLLFLLFFFNSFKVLWTWSTWRECYSLITGCRHGGSEQSRKHWIELCLNAVW